VTALEQLLASLEGFQWDEGNSDKSWRRHRVSQLEAEQVFFNQPVIAPAGPRQSVEQRFFALGRSDSGRDLAIVFTTRGKLVRVISARPMSRRERRAYAQAKPSTD
jgi:uncharacterized DUF497 family protein